MKIYVALIALLFFFSLSAEQYFESEEREQANKSYEEYREREISPFVLITVPKSGSHLVIKALYFLTNSRSIWHTRFPSTYTIPVKYGFLYTHLCLSEDLENDYAALPDLKRIINIRDLRDVAISMIGQILKAPWPGMAADERRLFKTLSFDEQLLYVINYEYDVQEVASFAPNSLQVSLSKIALQCQSLCKNKEYLVCRYENLVGEAGGGCADQQIRELERIALFLNIHLRDGEIETIAAQLYGNEYNPFGKQGFAHLKSTFNRGKVGGWKTLFKEEHKEVFKEKFGDVLIALGYEEDSNW